MDEQVIKIKLIEKRKEAEDVETFIFEKPNGIEYKAGQYGHFDLTQLTHPDPRGLSHHFTLSSSPTEDYLSFTTKIRKESGYKQTFIELSVGDRVGLRKVKGSFILEDETTKSVQVMIAGGIGITPYRSIIKYVCDKNLTIPIQLIYSVSTPEEFVFKSELDSLVQTHPIIKITYTVTHPEGSTAVWSGQTGRVDDRLLRDLILDLNTSVFWLCGPPPMVEAMEGLLKSLSVSSEHIKTERFTGY